MLEIKNNLSNILNNLLIILIGIIMLFVAQINNQDFVLSTITTKFIYFNYGCINLLGIYAFQITCKKGAIILISKIDMTLFFLVFYITINRYLIQSYSGFSIRYIELLGLSFLYLVLRSISLKNYPWLLLAIVLSGIIQAVYGNLQLFGYYSSNHSGFKMTGSFFNPGPYAGFLVSVWVVALGMYLFKDTLISRMLLQINTKIIVLNKLIKYIFEYIPILGLISIALVLPALKSRASWIAIIIATGVLLELRYHFVKKTFKKATNKFQKNTVVFITFIIVCTGLFSLYHYKKASSDGRAFIWKITTQMIMDNPIFGVGFDRFNAHYMNYQGNYFAENGETSESLVADNSCYAFNEWLQFVSENGLFGLLILLIVIYVLFQTKVNEIYQIEVFIARTGLLAIGVFACFSYPMQILPIKLILVFLIALLSNCMLNVYQLNFGYSKKSQWFYKTAILLVATTVMFQNFFYTNKLSQGFTTWNNALTSNQYGDYKEAVLEFESVYPIFKKDGGFLMNFGKTLALAEKPDKAITVLEEAKNYQNNTIIATTLGDCYKATKQYTKAEINYIQAINMIPSRFYSHYLLAKLYDESGQKEKAIALAKKILNKNVKIPSTAIKEIQLEMKKILRKHKNPLGFKN